MGMEKQTLAGTRVHRGLLLTLVIPTRNEADNVSRLVGELKVSSSRFVEEDLHWLTAYVSIFGPIFSLEKTREPAY
jgi:hypothetical protein